MLLFNLCREVGLAQEQLDLKVLMSEPSNQLLQFLNNNLLTLQKELIKQFKLYHFLKLKPKQTLRMKR